MALVVKNPPVNAGGLEMWIQSLGQEDPVEEGMATHSSILAWRIPRTEGPGGLQSTVSQKAGHDWSDLAHMLGGQVLIRYQRASEYPPVTLHSKVTLDPPVAEWFDTLRRCWKAEQQSPSYQSSGSQGNSHWAPNSPSPTSISSLPPLHCASA